MTPENNFASVVHEDNANIRWRKHEMIWISIVIGIGLVRCCWNWISLTPLQLESEYLSVYHNNNTPFTGYFLNVWLLQIVSLIIIYLCYLGINLLIIPVIKKIFLPASKKELLKNISYLMALSALLICLILTGTNLAMYFSYPYLFNHSGFRIASLFAYKDSAVVYVLYGFHGTMGVIAFISCLALGREIIIHYFDKRATDKAFRILIINQCTAFAVVYLSTIYLFSALNFTSIDPLFAIFILFAPSIFLVVMTNSFWLFPWKANLSFFSYRVIVRLLFSTCICTLPFFLSKGADLPHDQFILFLYCWIGQLFITTPLSWQVYRKRKDRILKLKGMEKELAATQADLQFLRSQINPHFLFNALNTIYGIALREKSADTAKAVLMLGDMMRFMLHENGPELIPIQKEIDYLKNYIVLQKLRMQSSPSMLIEDKIEGGNCSCLIAPMLLVPFIENAFKHGINPEKFSWIKIAMECDEKSIRFEVRNSLHPKSGNDPERESSGIGLKNVIQRLKLIYPGRHQINTGDDGQEFFVLLTIQP